MNTNTIIQTLTDAGFRVTGAGGGFVQIEDPACILRGFETFAEYAWIFITAVTFVLLFGWAVAMIRGAANDIMTNLRNLLLMFGALSAAMPAIEFFVGDDIGCRTVSVSLHNVNNLFETPLPTPPAQTQTPTQAPTQAPTPTPARTGGSVAWRNNNPGNITCGGGLQFGAVRCNGRFLVFPDESTGMSAIISLLKTSGYNKLTVGGAINRWAPPVENDTAAYQRTIERQTGIPLNTPLSSLDDAGLMRIANTIKLVEGWIPGTEETR